MVEISVRYDKLVDVLCYSLVLGLNHTDKVSVSINSAYNEPSFSFYIEWLMYMKKIKLSNEGWFGFLSGSRPFEINA